MKKNDQETAIEELKNALSKGAVYGAFVEFEGPYVTLDGTFDLEVIVREILGASKET